MADPSHVLLAGIDPVEAARVLGDAGAIFRVHGKDTGIDPASMRLNGGLDTKSYADLHRRSWVFTTYSIVEVGPGEFAFVLNADPE